MSHHSLSCNPSPLDVSSAVATDLMRLARVAGGLAGQVEQAEIPINRKAEILAELATVGSSLARAARIAQHSARAKSTRSEQN